VLGQSVLFDNKAGASGAIGAEHVKNSPADGYTFLTTTTAMVCITQHLQPLPYDPGKDFVPVARVATSWIGMGINPEVPANNLQEFIAYAKANPEKLNVGHAGLGSVSYIGCLLLHSALGIKPTMIPFTGTAPVLNAMLAGQVDYECDPVLGTLSQVQAGNVKALAVAAKKRSPLLPDVPTSYEQGLPEFDIAPFYAVFVPTGTPQPIVDKLVDALNKGLNEDAVKKRLAELGAESVEQDRRGPKALTDLIKAESARLLPILKAAAEKGK
jgi:tripartite-type tricarboxylate transporter receptor subunit TctC